MATIVLWSTDYHSSGKMLQLLWNPENLWFGLVCLKPNSHVPMATDWQHREKKWKQTGHLIRYIAWWSCNSQGGYGSSFNTALSLCSGILALLPLYISATFSKGCLLQNISHFQFKTRSQFQNCTQYWKEHTSIFSWICLSAYSPWKEGGGDSFLACK